MEREWWTLQEACFELQASKKVVFFWVETGQLYAFKTRLGHYRVLNPGPRIRRMMQEKGLEFCPLLSICEVAEVMGVSRHTVREHVRARRLRAVHRGQRFGLLFRPADVREYLWKREKLLRNGSRKVYIRRMVEWFLDYYAARSAGAVPQPPDDLEPLLDEILRLPANERRLRLSEIFRKLEKAKVVAQEIMALREDSRSPTTPRPA